MFDVDGQASRDNPIATELTKGVTANGDEFDLADFTLDTFGPYGGVVSVPVHNVIELNGAFPLSDLRDTQVTTGTGSITDSVNGEYRVRHATGSDTAMLLSSARGRYIPDAGARSGVGARCEGTISDATSVAEWGYFDASAGITVGDGFLFGVDSGGVYIRVVRAGTETHKAYQSAWNVNPNLGIDPFNITDGWVYQVDFTYYGHGLIHFYVVKNVTGELRQRRHLIHTFKSSTGTSIANPNLKSGVRVESTAGADDFSVYVSGRSFTVIGDYRPKTRDAAHTAINAATSTTVAPVVSFRRKTGSKWVPITEKIAGFDALAATEDAILSLHVNGTLTGASWGAITDLPATETSLEVDTTATGISGGVKVWEGLVAAGQGNSSSDASFAGLNLEIPDNAIVSFCARSISGTGTVTVTGRMMEEW